jgi:hypothetical protein
VFQALFIVSLQELIQILQGFQSISLAEMDGVQLMNRTDTKFMFNNETLLEILPDLASTYRVLEVENVRVNRYQTLYYDTPSFFHFLQHQNGKKHRYKIRKREYVESNISFLEIKEKNNKGRTAKSRIKLAVLSESLDEKGLNFIERKAEYTENLEPKLWNSFTRTTLVDTVAGERVTLDTNIAFHFNGKVQEIPFLVIAEVKQDGANRHSRFIRHMKERLIRPEGISKYCLGVALLFPNIKSNTFKEKILKIQKLNHNAPQL